MKAPPAILASQAAKTYSLLFDDPLPICNSQEQWVEWAEQRASLLDKWHCLPALAMPPAANPRHGLALVIACQLPSCHGVVL